MACATPKSSTFAATSLSSSSSPQSSGSRMFSGFRSPWRTPSRCADSIAAHAAASMRLARETSSRPSATSSRCRSTPRTSSITRYGPPSGSEPQANTRTIDGCVSRASVCASRRKRSRAAGSGTSSGRITLIATGRSSTTSRAAYTAPIPPRPSSPSIRYLPSGIAGQSRARDSRPICARIVAVQTKPRVTR